MFSGVQNRWPLRPTIGRIRPLLAISVVLLNGCWGSQLMGVLDFLAMHEMVSKHRKSKLRTRVRTFGFQGEEVILGSGLRLPVEPITPETRTESLVVIPGVEFTSLRKTLDDPANQWGRLGRLLGAAQSVLGISTGAFVLAQTGRLNGKAATTHGRFEEALRIRYPEVQVRRGVDYVDNGDICTVTNNAGAMFWLAKQLRERGGGQTVDQAVALATNSQDLIGDSWAIDTYAYKNHSDQAILKVQALIDAHFDRRLSLRDLAEKACMSETNLKRRFKLATGTSASQYCQVVRVARMKYLLINTRTSIDDLSAEIGYADSRFARRIFRAITGRSPLEFRQGL